MRFQFCELPVRERCQQTVAYRIDSIVHAHISPARGTTVIAAVDQRYWEYESSLPNGFMQDAWFGSDYVANPRFASRWHRRSRSRHRVRPGGGFPHYSGIHAMLRGRDRLFGVGVTASQAGLNRIHDRMDIRRGKSVFYAILATPASNLSNGPIGVFRAMRPNFGTNGYWRKS
jgi:hypothetical protein